MPRTWSSSPILNGLNQAMTHIKSGHRAVSRHALRIGSLFILPIMIVCLGISGCGSSGGYPGGGLKSLSASSVTIDAGQSIGITATLSSNLNLSWALNGASCSGAACGTLSSSSGTDVTYTAPSDITQQMKVTLTASTANTKNSKNVEITVNPAPTITGTLPDGTVGTAYTATLVAAGGTAPLKLSIASGSLPPGLSFDASTGVISGTPTTDGTSSFTVQLVDSSDIPVTITTPETIKIAALAVPPLTLTTTALPDGTVGVPYSATVGVTGGTSPYSCSITAGTLPDGLIMAGCVVSGTPTTAGTSTVAVNVTDSSSPAGTTSGPETITINAAGSDLAISTLPDGTVGVAYSATVNVTGGTSPYTCTITGLPAGLSATGCTVSGTPTTAGSSTVTVEVTDSSSPAKTRIVTQTITIAAAGSLSLTGTLPNAILNTAYSQTLVATGGAPPYTYSITAGTLPAGITLADDSSTPTKALFSGTPTAAGASSFTLTVTDSADNTASLPLVLLVAYPTTPNDSELDGPYAFLFQGYDDVASGLLAYQTAAVGSFTADGAGLINAGERDSNHQTSAPTTTTVAQEHFIGTYQVGTDHRGMVTITTLNTDGTTGQTSTYAIALAAPVSPSTISTQGSLIEYDNDEQTGTRGSGTLLAQTSSDFASGLNGSYAFGLSGDTSCLVACTLGISGPVATVGQFTTDGSGSITGGLADANVASTNYPTAPLTGAYQPADLNGRVQLSLLNSTITNGEYPSDFAVYIVNANQAFLVSTDKHSSYILLAGSARLQTESTFGPLNGPIIGYENAQSNPGLLGVTLQNVLNYSTATIFRATGDNSGSCNMTNVDSAGLTSLVNALSGIGNQSTLLQALLGTTAATGTSTCPVNGNNGRGMLNYPAPSGLITTLLQLLGLPTGAPAPRVFYLYAPNEGYFLETGYAGLGQFEAQTGTPFGLGTLSGSYAEGSIAAASLASINTSGDFTSDGAGNASQTFDQNLGVGNINILNLGTAQNTTYTLSPNDTTTGRYVLADGTTVLYAISPNRFVMVNTSPTEVSPGVSVLFK